MSTATSKSDTRLEILAGPPSGEMPFAEAIRAGLRAPEKHLYSKYLYDDVGSALFDTITVLPEYYLTRAETEILREWGWEIVRALGNPVEFVELGSGSAAKTRLLIEEALRVQRTLRYSPIDISEEALRSSAQALVAAYPTLSVSAFAGDYFGVLRASMLQRPAKMLVMFMGSNIGNYEPAGAASLLELIAGALKPGDGLLLGTDLKKDRETLELAYNDPTGVTAAFNRNLLARINRELDADFDVRAFKHVSHYDEARGAVFSHLLSKRKQSVRIEAIGETFDFDRGERIHTESSYKYSPADIDRLAARAGLRVSRFWSDGGKRFRVNLLTR